MASFPPIPPTIYIILFKQTKEWLDLPILSSPTDFNVFCFYSYLNIILDFYNVLIIVPPIKYINPDSAAIDRWNDGI